MLIASKHENKNWEAIAEELGVNKKQFVGSCHGLAIQTLVFLISSV